MLFMAHYKRGKDRTAGKATRGGSFLKSYPRWHDIVFHRRPQRRRTKALERAILKGGDPDVTAWPLQRKPHVYYW
jgi:hypothetical protein